MKQIETRWPLEDLRGTAGFAVSPVFLKHDGHFAEFQPAPADAAFGHPLVCELEAEAVDVEAEGRFDIGHVEERDRLLYVGCGLDLGGHLGIQHTMR